jgi:ribosomal protein S20
MANHKSAIKRIRVHERRRLRNRPIISRTRTEVRTARQAMQAGDPEPARQAVLQAIRTPTDVGCFVFKRA